MRRLLLVAVIVVAGCGSDDGDDGSSAGGETVQLTATDFRFDRAEISVAAGETTFTLTNDGESEHALEIEGEGLEEETDTIGPGDSASVTIDLQPGEYEVYCPVGDHRSRGMEGTLIVGAGSGGAGTTTGETETGETETGEDGAYGG